MAQAMAIKQFHKLLAQAKRVVVLTGAGVSAESGIPTFRGEGGLWRKYVSLHSHAAVANPGSSAAADLHWHCCRMPPCWPRPKLL